MQVFDGRGLSPVIGTVLLLGILVVLAASGGYMFFSMTDQTDARPNAQFTVEPVDGETEYVLQHDGGDVVDGDNIEVRGVADSDVGHGKTFDASTSVTVYPTSETVSVVWVGEHETSYELQTTSVDRAFPEPDEGCEWVDDQTDGGSDPIKIDGEVVDCEVETTDLVEVQNDGVVVGSVVSDSSELDVDDSTVYGDVTVEKVANVQDGSVTGAVVSETADVKVLNTSVDGDVSASKVAELTSGSVVAGDVLSESKDVKVLDSEVEGSVVSSSGLVKLQDVVVEGDVFVDSGSFDCTNSTINGQDCGEYSPKSPSDW